ncbi:MAG: hypothetical protein AC479_02950 [miscellaneous Crenarchaeota group-6 archaeon AD8-1]|nr:MAG: hypothetical protein AC479_02950 [miscellaneous Crenarchaeota group-6 archaeon AD8-1]
MRSDLILVKQYVVGLVLVTILSGLMFIFSYLFYGHGESNVSLILLFAGLGLAGVLAVAVLTSKNSDGI